MKKFLTVLISIFGLFVSPSPSYSQSVESTSALDYTRMIILDAEDLAETGIKDAYEKLIPTLKLYVRQPAPIVENFNITLPSYRVSGAGVHYDIYSPSLPNKQAESWGRATVAFFAIVNKQLRSSPVKLYAINDGNDLGGMFLTSQQVRNARKKLKNKTDWPYLPKLEHPWYGKYHD